MGSSAELIATLNHRLQFKTPQESNLEGALDLMSRAVALHDAVKTLGLPYTYDIVRVPAAKRAARKQLGTMSGEIIADMRNELLEAAVVCYLRSRGLTFPEIDRIFREPNGTGETGVDNPFDRIAERTSETACSTQAEGLAIVSDREHVGGSESPRTDASQVDSTNDEVGRQGAGVTQAES